MKRIKEFLESAKAFLENYSVIIDFLNTFFTLLLTIIGLCLSYAAFSISERQLRIEESLSQPLISTAILYNDDMTAIQDIIYSNNGGPVTDFTVKTVPYYHISFYVSEDEDSFFGGEISIPVQDVLHPVFYVTNTNSKTGTLSSITTTSAIESYQTEMDLFLDYVSEKNPTLHISSVSLNYYLSLSYNDYWKNQYAEYYHCITGYYQSNADEEDMFITTFIPPKFRYLSDADTVPSFVIDVLNGDTQNCYFPDISEIVYDDPSALLYSIFMDALTTD